ncbi:hypothetical protein GJAV_G00071420 [Gymnothorax javanicus]|nr:hypothetical protein GJAV_G00071420 [Gymnothorax javanicus]
MLQPEMSTSLTQKEDVSILNFLSLQRKPGRNGSGLHPLQARSWSAHTVSLQRARSLLGRDSTLTSERAIRPESLSSKPLVRVRVVRRAGEVTELPPLSHQELNLHGNASPLPPNEGADHTPLAGPSDRVDHSHSGPAGPIEKAADDSTVGVKGKASSAVALRVRWQSDTGRCVDASAVLLVSEWGDSDRAVAYVGSHSHRLQAIALKEGHLLWERVLGDRLEASAAVTPCGSLVAIGCYDGRVYFLSAAKGNTHWVFATGNAVKSSPAVDILTGLVLVGSHDGHIYALDPQAQCCRWSQHCGGGAIFSSPCLDPTHRQLYVATLKGDLLCLNPESGALLWSHSNTTPFFSSPCCSNSSLCIGSVDSNIYCFSHRGSMLWQFPTDGPIFSSPCSRPTSLANQKVYCGSHDGCVYCLSDGALLWRFQAGGKVFSSPFLFPRPGCAGEDLVAVATTNGTLWILGAKDGVPQASLSLPGEVFSSPVLWGRTLVVGCRNDYVYGIDLTSS